MDINESRTFNERGLFRVKLEERESFYWISRTVVSFGIRRWDSKGKVVNIIPGSSFF